MSENNNAVKTVIENYIKSWQTNDKELMLSLYADDVCWEDPVGTPAFIGLEGVAKFWDSAHGSDGRMLSPKVHQIIACGNEGIVRFTMQVRLPEGDRGLDLDVVDQFILNDAGKIQSGKAYWDESCVKCPEGMQLFVPDLEYD